MPKLYNQATNKQGLIVYGGETSVDHGMVVSEVPTFERPNRKQTVYDIPGRNGSIVMQEDAWSDITRSYKVWLADNPKKSLVEIVNDAEAWLNSKTGYQRLEDSFEPDVFRLAYYSGGVDVSNSFMQYGEATIKFTCRPERFLKDGEQEITVADDSIIYNPTRFSSKPLIHIEGSGSVSLSISGVTITATITDYINIDVERMNAYRLPGENMNNKISGSFPILTTGNNPINITGAVTSASIIPRFFTI